ncbi:hypothetical protein GUA87_01585 [Sneathiella sp. P13V-1]|uniref:Acg family FMN-binding oxidoreductase n=1 Tax=Sneathiella sp. P13V-1 TaxID=2697366 RepID=UPI00187B5F4D|nr:hypothetical protein [Sneathiella sp. P13V-1]MBE7635520.1 hypothetical protein [Sneathiella sp. P13V-1]
MEKRNSNLVSRRGLLKKGFLVSGGVAVVAAGGLVWRGLEEDIFSPFDGPAYEPWSTWKTDPMEGPLALVQMAILAASPHNTQPWRFKVTDNRIEIYADRARHLGDFDPYRREMQIGFGCAIENIVQSAPAHGLDAKLAIKQGTLDLGIKSNGSELIAVIDLVAAGKQVSDLFKAIPHRHTDRSPYDRSKAVPQKILQKMTEMAEGSGVDLKLFEEGESRTKFDQIMMAATNAIVSDMSMVQASHDWIRTTDAAIQKHKDGPTLDGAGLPAMIKYAAKIFPDPSAKTGHEMWRDATESSHLATAPVTGFLSVIDRYDKSDNVIAGQVWQRLHLLATTYGLSMHPMNQPVEMIDREKQLGKAPTFDRQISELLGSRDWQPTFAFRMGYRDGSAPISPRKPVREVLI